MTAAAPTPLDLGPVEARLADLTERFPIPLWVFADGDSVYRRQDGQPDLLLCSLWHGLADEALAAVGEFIAHARTDVPALVAEVRRLRSAMTAAEAYRDAEQRALAVAAQHIPPSSGRLARMVAVDAVEALAARLGRLAEAAEVRDGQVPR